MQSRTSGERGENVTVLICASASGLVFPPFIIFKGQHLNVGLTANALVLNRVFWLEFILKGSFLLSVIVHINMNTDFGHDGCIQYQRN